MLEEIMDFVHNYFEYRIVRGKFVVSSGNLDCDFLQDGQYFKVVGSVFNNGVWQYPATEMHDEEFDGEVWLLAVPYRLSNLATEIEQWCTDNADTLKSPYQSESFGGYSYTKANGNANGNGNAVVTWREVFGAQLNQWRKIS